MIQILEDSAGGVWLVPEGEGIVIGVGNEEAGTPAAESDARLYGQGWDASDALRVHLLDGMQTHRMTEVARLIDDEWIIWPERMGTAAQWYILGETLR